MMSTPSLLLGQDAVIRQITNLVKPYREYDSHHNSGGFISFVLELGLLLMDNDSTFKK